MSESKIKNNIRLLHKYSFWENFIMFYPIKILFFAEVSGSFTVAMSLFAIQNISSALFELPTGCLSDKLGRKWVCCAGAFVMLMAFILYALANCYWVLLVASILNGLSWSLATGNNNALLYDSLTQIKKESSYHKEISKNVSFAQLSLGVSSLVGVIFALVSLRSVMIASIVPASIAFFITLGLTEPQWNKNINGNIFKHIWGSIKYICKHPRLRYITVAETMHYGLNEAAFDFNSVFFKQFVPEWSLGIFRSINHLVNSIANYLSFYVAKRIGLKATIIIGTYLDNAINIISVLVASVFSPVIKIATAFCKGLKEPALDTLIQNDCSVQQRATIMSVMSLLASIFYSICAMSIGVLADITSPYIAMLSAYILALTGNGLFFIAIKNNVNVCKRS